MEIQNKTHLMESLFGEKLKSKYFKYHLILCITFSYSYFNIFSDLFGGEHQRLLFQIAFM